MIRGFRNLHSVTSKRRSLKEESRVHNSSEIKWEMPFVVQFCTRKRSKTYRNANWTKIYVGISRRPWFRRKCINNANKFNTFFLTNCWYHMNLLWGKLFFAIDEVPHFELKHWTIYLERDVLDFFLQKIVTGTKFCAIGIKT